MYLQSTLQGRKYGSRILAFAESMAKIAEIEVVSCRSDLFPIYAKRGYREVRRHPATDYIPLESLTRPTLEMVVMQKVVPVPEPATIWQGGRRGGHARRPEPLQRH